MSAPTLRQLAAVDILAGLSDNDLGEIGRRMRHRRWPAGHPFVGHRDESRDVYVVLEGKVRVTIYSESGREVSFRDLDAGATFGELAAIDRKPRSANVAALTDVLVGSIPAAEFMALMRQYPSVAEAVLVKLADLVRALSQRLYELSEPVPVRICTELIHMAEARSQDGRTARLRPPPKHADIASRLLTHREAVSRLLSDLRREGLVERGRGELVIRDIPRLREFAEELQGA